MNDIYYYFKDLGFSCDSSRCFAEEYGENCEIIYPSEFDDDDMYYGSDYDTVLNVKILREFGYTA